MARIQNKNIHQPLIITGYTLFFLLIAATLLSTTIPFGVLLFNPKVMHYNVAVTTIALTIGTFLPALVGYFIGERSTKSKDSVSHHFNGVLFGLLAFSLMTLSVTIIPIEWFASDLNTRMIVMNLLPSIIIAIVTTLLAVAHVRSRQAKQDIIEYAPFSVALIAALVALPLWSLGTTIATGTVDTSSFILIAIILVLGLLSYVSLRKTQLSNHIKRAWAAVSLSVLFVTVFVSTQLVFGISTFINARPTMEYQTVVGIVGMVLMLAGWLTYWAWQVKALQSKTRGKK